MSRPIRNAVAAIAILVIAAIGAVVALGGGDDEKEQPREPLAASAKQAIPKSAKRGGTVTYLATADVDYIDPGLTYYQFATMVQSAVNRTLYAYKPSDSVRPVPDLATAMPKISPDRKSLTIRIRSGVRFSPPVNREVVAADVKYGFERAFTKQVPSGYVATYFGDLVGVPAKPNTGDYKPISGIETPDEHTLIFRFTRPSAPLAAAAMVMPVTAPVPKEYAGKFDAKAPSTYDQHVAFTGPYMVKNDADGKLVGRKPGKLIQLVRNPSWNAKTDFRPAYLDAINIEEGNTNLAVAARRVLNGSRLLCCDAGGPPPAVLEREVKRHKDLFTFLPAGNTRWVSMNIDVPPFDNLNVRKAVIAGFDRNALRVTIGGPLLGKVASGFIPAGVPGFQEAGGERQNADLDFLRNPNGDPALAKKYMLAAKAEGVPVTDDGKYAGKKRLLTIATNADPGKKTAEVAQAQFEKLGFKVNLRNVPQDTLYTKFCMVRKAKVPICTNVGFGKDFADPQTVLDPTFNGKRVTQAVTSNYSFLNDPAINAEMAKATSIPAGPERYKAWARINHMVSAAAPAIPWVWDNYALMHSRDVVGVGNAFFPNFDLSYTSVK